MKLQNDSGIPQFPDESVEYLFSGTVITKFDKSFALHICDFQQSFVINFRGKMERKRAIGSLYAFQLPELPQTEKKLNMFLWR